MTATRLLLAALTVSLSFLSLAPAVEAVSTLNCGAGTNVWEVDYVCTVGGFGVDGQAHLCPPDATCVATRYCYVTLSPLDVRCV